MRNNMTLQQAQALLASHNMVLKFSDGEYCVNYRHGGEGTAEYSESLVEVIELGLAKAKRNEARQTGKRMKSLQQWAMAFNGQV